MSQYRRILIGVVSLLLYSPVSGYTQPQYTLTDLGAFQPNAIAGPWVVGVEHGLPTRLNLDTMQKITLGHEGNGGTARAVLDTGEAVGWINIPGASGLINAAVVWDAAGQVSRLPGPVPSVARGINGSGTIAGSSDACPGGVRAMRWWPDGRWECLATTGLRASRGADIDAQHRVWGYVDQGSGISQARMWNVDGSEVNPGLPPLDIYAETIAVSPDGMATGFAAIATWVLTLEDGFTALPMPRQTHGYCAGTAINRHRQVVGWWSTGATVEGLFWPSLTQVYRLADLVMPADNTLRAASGISDDAEIIGARLDGSGFLLTPMPPSLAMRLNQTSFAPGQTLRMDLTMHNNGPMLTVDVYVGVILPDGQTVLWLINTAPLEGVVTRLDADPRTFTPMLRNVTWPAGLDVTQEGYLSYTFTGEEAPGIYHLLVGWTTPGSLEDGRIDEGDVLALAWAPIQVNGGRAPEFYATQR